MNNHNPLIICTIVMLLGFTGSTIASSEVESATTAAQAGSEARLEAEYNSVLAQVEKERQAAEASVAKAREQLQVVTEQEKGVATERVRLSAVQAAEMETMQQELNHARRQLRETSREISRVNSELARARSDRQASRFVFRSSDRPVIGVILGDADDVGVKVLGVSPDGPSERAGIKQGDIIVAVGGRVLASIAEADNARKGLNIVLQEIEANGPLIVSVERGDQTLDLTVIPEVREPLTWSTVTRFPTAPHEPGAPNNVVTIERIEIPEINSAELAEQIAQMQVEVEKRRAVLNVARVAPVMGEHEYDFEFHEMSEMGDFALHDANVWFGLPMAQGLQLAEIDSDLGEYFKTERGVLVLKANADNHMQLKSGDVILQVGDTEVNSPAEFMRALRDFQSGDDFELNIKRNRKDRTIKTQMPQNWTSHVSPHEDTHHSIRITTTLD